MRYSVAPHGHFFKGVNIVAIFYIKKAFLSFMNLYLKAVRLALNREFKVHLGMIFDKDYGDIAKWRKIYYDYNLSEESFKQDVEEPLRLNEEEKPTGEWHKV